MSLNSLVKNDIQYIDYERLKDVLYEFKENAPAEDSVEKSEIERYFQQSSESFFQEIEKELQKVNLFFGEKLNEAARRFTQLKVRKPNPSRPSGPDAYFFIERCWILSKSRRKGKIKSQNFKNKCPIK